MNTKAKLRSFVAKLLIIATTSACLTTQSYAGAISTEAALATDRERILVLLDRPDVSAQLEAYGVKPSDAKARVGALSDEEIAQLSIDIDKAVAGAGGGEPIAALAGAVAVVVVVVALAAVLLVGAAIYGAAKLASRAFKSANADPSVER